MADGAPQPVHRQPTCAACAASTLELEVLLGRGLQRLLGWGHPHYRRMLRAVQARLSCSAVPIIGSTLPPAHLCCVQPGSPNLHEWTFFVRMSSPGK